MDLAAQKPNIVFFLIDDLGCRDLGSFGSSFYETPNLDRLVESGMKFNRAFASCPVCSPTRASIMTGKYPARVGITDWIGGNNQGRLLGAPYLHYLPLEETSVATALKGAGYQTWHVGKWHLGDEDFYPDRHGFDVNIGGTHAGMPMNGYWSPWNIATLPEDGVPEGTYLTDHITDRALDLIDARSDAPFFLHLSHFAVHTPIQAPADLVEKYEKKAQRLRLDRVPAIVEGEGFSCIEKSDRCITRRVLQSDPVYAAMVENLDQNIGRVLDKLEAEGLLEDTLIVLTSDNGGLATAEGAPTCNAPYAEGKGWGYDGGVRVCQMMSWKGKIRAGSETDAVVTSTDFYPTLLRVAGLDPMPEQHVDGLDLCPVLEENSSLNREAIFWHYPHYSNQGGTPCAVVYDGHWKLIEYFEAPQSPELYHTSSDPSEVNDVAAQHPREVERLSNLLQAWKREVEAKIPEPNEGWERKMKRPKVPNNACE